MRPRQINNIKVKPKVSRRTTCWGKMVWPRLIFSILGRTNRQQMTEWVTPLGVNLRTSVMKKFQSPILNATDR